MSCTRCSQPLPTGAVSCPACGLPVATNISTSFNDPVRTTLPSTDAPLQQEIKPDYAGLAFQEFSQPAAGMASDLFRPVTPPPGQMPPGMFVSLQPPDPRLSGQPGSRRRRFPVGIIILCSVLAVVLVIAGLSIAFFEVGSRTIASSTAAMQMYQQMTRQRPTINDPLNASSKSWATYDQPPYNCDQESDGLHIKSTKAGTFAPCFADEYGMLTNFVFQVRMQVISGSGGGLVFRASPVQAHFYLFQVNVNGSYLLLAYQGKLASDSTVLTTGVASKFNNQTGQTNLLTVIAQGNRIYLYVNQVFLASVQNTALTTGEVGVVASDEGTAAETVYTQASVWIPGS